MPQSSNRSANAAETSTFGSPWRGRSPWRRSGPRPGWRQLVAAAWIAALFGVGASSPAMAQGGDAITIMPDNEVPRGPPRDLEEAPARSAELIRKYPHDPRARLDRALALLLSMDVAGAASSCGQGSPVHYAHRLPADYDRRAANADGRPVASSTV